VNADDRRWSQDYHQSAGGYELAFSGVIFSLIGLWIDRKLGTIPWFTVGLAALGFFGAVANIYYRYTRDIDRDEAQARARQADR